MRMLTLAGSSSCVLISCASISCALISCSLAVAVAAASPAWAETPTIAPADAKTHVGQTVTVEGAVGNIATGRSGTTFIDVGGRYPDNSFAVVIFAADKSKFPDLKTFDGRTVTVTGPISLYRGKPEIIVKSADQMKAK